MSKRLPLTLRILAALKLRAFTVSELRQSLCARDDSIRDAIAQLLETGLVEKRTQTDTGGAPAWLYGLAL